jgi:uncharacterized membrane protein YgcG
MTTPMILGTALCVVLFVWAVRRAQRNAQRRIMRAEYIARYVFPTSVRFKLNQTYPDLSDEQINTILRGLRMWFQLLAANPRTQLGMPSQAVDTAWHEFILLTKNYADFCEKAFGKFLHHTPHSAGAAAEREGLARTYGLSMAFVGIAGAAGVAGATALRGRDLFDLDQTLGVPGGNSYTPDDLRKYEKRYQHMQASSSDGGGGGAGGGVDSHHGSDGGGSGGDGGGGCGGGCGS